MSLVWGGGVGASMKKGECRPVFTVLSSVYMCQEFQSVLMNF